MKTIYYSVDVAHLLNLQKEQSLMNREREDRIKEEGMENKKKLLKYVLPLMHGIFAIHNNKCIKANYSSSGRDGFLGYSKINIEEEIQRIASSGEGLSWSNNFTCFSYHISGRRGFKIWLHVEGNYVHNRNMEYSMTTVIFDGKTYAESIEKELESVAKYCARYTDNWED